MHSDSRAAGSDCCLNLPCPRSPGSWGGGVPPACCRLQVAEVLGGREVLPSQLTDLMEKTSSIFMTASSFWCGKFQESQKIEHYNDFCAFLPAQQWSVYSHLASLRLNLFPPLDYHQKQS